MSSAHYKGLIAFDLDGTVLASMHNTNVTPRVDAAFQAAHDAGWALSVSSGRPLAFQSKELLSNAWLDWVISSNGATVTNMRTGAQLKDTQLPYELTQKAINAVKGLETSYWIDHDDKVLVERRDPRASEIVGAFDAVDTINDFYTYEPAKEGIRKIMIHFETPEACAAAQARLDALQQDWVCVTEGPTIEITSDGCTKAQGALAICNQIGVAPKDSIAFGDSGNDISYAEVPIKFVVMNSAEPWVRNLADDICPDVYHDGVAQWLEEHIL